MKLSIAKKLVLYFIFTVIISILITGIISNIMIDSKFNQYLEERHKAEIGKIRSLVEDLYNEKTGFSDESQSEIDRYATMEEVYIEARDSKNNVIFSSGNQQLINKSMMSPMMGKMMQNMMGIRQGEYMEEKYALEKQGKSLGTIIIGYYGSWNITYGDVSFKETLNKSFLISASAALLLGLLVSIILSRQISIPLSRITRVSNAMRTGNLDERSRESSDTIEINELSESINYLAETLKGQEGLRKRMTSDISHELRTPLSALQTTMEALMDGVYEPTKETFESCYDEIKRLTKLVDNLRNIEKLEEANLELNRSKFDISRELEKIGETFRPQYNKKSIRLIEKIAPEIHVSMDRDKIKEIMYNLLSNAYKYSFENGEVELILLQDKGNVVIKVKDNGMGIGVKDLPNIFERFYRGDLSRARETGGSGIGLTITKAMVEAHGGKISVESASGKGSTFTVEFPNSPELKNR